MNWTEVGAQWLHIMFGTSWFGRMPFSNHAVIPAIARLPAEGRGAAMAAVADQANRITPWVAVMHHANGG